MRPVQLPRAPVSRAGKAQPGVPQVCLITAGHLTTCPRVVKAADALAEAGHRVRVVSAEYLPWATAADGALLRHDGRAWSSTIVSYAKSASRTAWLRTGVRARLSRVAARALGPPHAPTPLVARALSRAFPELVRAAVSARADLFYGFTAGGLPVAAAAGRMSGVPWALDLEDFHTAEQDDSPEAFRAHALMEQVERRILPGAALLTAGSPAIAEAYAEKYPIDVPITLNNTFPLPADPPDLTPTPGPGLRMYWFSQTLGPGRGIEDAIGASGLAGFPGELHLRGAAVPGYVDHLRQFAAARAPGLAIVHHEPEPPDPVELCRRGRYDVGLALEQGHVLNRRLCRTNKAFTYMLAGLAIAFTDTPGQRAVARDLREGALLYRPGDVEALAAGLKRWAADRIALRRAKAAAWEAARRRWHWEHPEERGALLEAVAKVLGR